MIKMKGICIVLSLVVLGLASSIASASDPSPLQDFCVAVKDSEIESALFVNGKFCKNPKDVTANDFFFQGLDKPRDTSNPLGSNVTQLNVDKIAGLNTLGISLARIDYAPHGLNPPHIHPHSTEILVVVQGTLEFNKGYTNAVAFAGLSSQNATVITIANAVFDSDPRINPNVLTKAFQVDKNVIENLQKQFWVDNNN
ncbi:hypothetical protein FEM48_Zijuj02G0177200 [Ziziphus jujuba var. spinosa]|uniref:Cupin type-1 domain-containing protein n=1 Tax=Ziziphus jujuba var. spinosa TaxID=714518 RepID=A0A978VX27_ZIZJJ|nr:hypothetical protein FEM48_Zijuj02G0177200 [Ziziphus jujuba var. spinosa]